EDDAGEVAHARLLETGAPRDDPELFHAPLREGKDELQLPQVEGEGNTGLDDAGLFQEPPDDAERVAVAQREEIYRPRRGNLHEARQVAFALPEWRTGLGVEPDYALICEVGTRGIQLRGSLHQHDPAFVAANRQARQRFARNRARMVDRHYFSRPVL